MTVLIDGPTLSRLLFSYLNNTGNQYGLLLGEKIDQVESRISDLQMHTSDVNSLFCVSSFLPWPSNEPMFSRSGCINEDSLQQLIKATDQRVVGWYSFRHQSVLRTSLKEMTLHDSLASNSKFGGSAEDFLFFLCTSSSSSNMSTFICNHVVMQLKQGDFKALPVTILNLGDTTRKEYKKESNATLSHCSSVKETLQHASKRFVQPCGEMDQVVRVSSLASSLNKNLEALKSKLTQSEGILGLLEADVDTLRGRLKQVEQEEIRELLASDAERRQREEQQGRVVEDEAAEAEEQAQMEKLLKDLGLAQTSVESACVEKVTEVTTNDVPGVSQVPMEIVTACDKIHGSSEAAGDSKVVVQESEESNESDSSESLSVNKMNGQKTYSYKKESNHLAQVADPFGFLVTENEKEKEKLMKPNKPLTKTMAKANACSEGNSAVRFSNSIQTNGHVKKSKFDNKTPDMNSSDDDASVSSNEAQEIENTASGTEDPGFESYVISSSPSF